MKQDLRSGCSIGFVPTMGALHRGHLSLIELAKQENDCVVVSIFVNPLQFAVGEDLAKYPRTLERDRQLCESVNSNVIFAPNPQDLGVQVQVLTQVVPPAEMTGILCGRSRLGHFTGVATIVTKLLQIVQPHRLYLGQKDGQQLAILRKLVTDLNMPVQVIGCPTVRESDGLAMSSRNQYLEAAHREAAPAIYQALCQASVLFEQGVGDRDRLIAAVESHLTNKPLIALEYVDLVDALSLQRLNSVYDAGANFQDGEQTAMLAIAARVGTTRLIDNILLNSPR
jgi:pantoate ligase / CMP/dCMP kinase